MQKNEHSSFAHLMTTDDFLKQKYIKLYINGFVLEFDSTEDAVDFVVSYCRKTSQKEEENDN